MTVTDLYIRLFGKGGLKDGTVIDMAEHGRAGGVSTGDGFKSIRDVEEETIIDEASSTVTYVGKAQMNAATSDPVWQIKKISVSGNVTSIAYASGSSYNSVWDNRASLTYT